MIYALLICVASSCQFTGIIASYNLCEQVRSTGLEAGRRLMCVRLE